MLGAKYVSTAVRQFSILYQSSKYDMCHLSAVRVFDFVLPRTLLVPLVVQLFGDITNYYRVRSLPMGREFESQPTVDLLQVCSFHLPIRDVKHMQHALGQECGKCLSSVL